MRAIKEGRPTLLASSDKPPGQGFWQASGDGAFTSGSHYICHYISHYIGRPGNGLCHYTSHYIADIGNGRCHDTNHDRDRDNAAANSACIVHRRAAHSRMAQAVAH
jgi:hypothetical protein